MNPYAHGTHALVRDEVTRILRETPAFHQLPPAAQLELVDNMEKVGAYVADAGGETRDVPVTATIMPPRPLRARALADPPPDPFNKQPEKMEDLPGGYGEAGRQGVANLGSAISSVNFPEFVGGLISGVFRSIVSASIEQMEAYAELLKNVAKTADQYMKDNISEDQANEYLASRYPDHMEADLSGGETELRFRPDADEATLPDFVGDLGLPFPLEGMDDEQIQERLVPAARKKLAIDRQQMLLSLVLMGINRIVVTDGKISASVVFSLDTTSLAKRKFDDTFTGARTTHRDHRENVGGFWGWFGATRKVGSTSDVINVETVNENDSTEKQSLKVNLKGNVDIRFKSETFPLDRMGEILGLGDKLPKERVRAPATAPPPEAALIPPPPMPALAGR